MSHTSWVPEFEAYAGDVAATHEIPGVAVAVAQHGEVIYAGGSGYRDAAPALPATPDTVFGIGSVTKSFTALAVMQLADAGKLSVADPVVRWLPEFKLPRPEHQHAITVHHFLTHSSGLPPEPALLHARAASLRKDPDLERIRGVELPPDFASMRLISTYEELMELMAAKDFDLLGPPGRFFSYSNEGYALLQGIVERASGRPFMSYLREHILDPLAMTHTGTQAEMLARSPTVTQLYARRAEGDKDVVFASPTWHDIGQIFGNGGLASTVQDLVRYLEVYRNQGTVDGVRILSPAGTAKMTAPHIAVPTGGFYGYGLRVHPEYHGVSLVEHGGGNKGIAAHICVARDKGITAAALTNLTGAPAVKVTLGAINALMGLPLDTPLEAFPEYDADPQHLARFVGTYQAERTTARFYLQDGVLYREMQGRSLAARPYAEDAVVVAPDMPVRFLTNADGAVWAASFGLRIYRKVE